MGSETSGVSSLEADVRLMRGNTSIAKAHLARTVETANPPLLQVGIGRARARDNLETVVDLLGAQLGSGSFHPRERLLDEVQRRVSMIQCSVCGIGERRLTGPDADEAEAAGAGATGGGGTTVDVDDGKLPNCVGGGDGAELELLSESGEPICTKGRSGDCARTRRGLAANGMLEPSESSESSSDESRMRGLGRPEVRCALGSPSFSCPPWRVEVRGLAIAEALAAAVAASASALRRMCVSRSVVYVQGR